MKFVGIFIFLILIGTHSSVAQTAPSGGEIVYLSQEENQFYILLNKFRTALGLPTFQIHVYLQNASKKHSAWMAEQDFLSHYGPVNNKTPFERMTEEGYVNYTSMGENVACGNADAIKTFRQWALSPGHLANMISPHFKHIGISRAGTGNEQCPYFWTNDFGSMSDRRQDPPAVSDLQLIKAAVESVSGPIPSDKKIQLPIQQQNGVATETQATPETPKNNYSLIQCMVPYALAKNILTFMPNTDAIMEITPNDFGSYKAKVSYLLDGEASDYYPMIINNVSVIKNANYPLILIFASSTSRNSTGFLIQFDTSTSGGTFDPYPASSGTSGSVLCSYKN
jgi:uncharacterized protein YkwD